jgi:hypothetical protein
MSEEKLVSISVCDEAVYGQDLFYLSINKVQFPYGINADFGKELCDKLNSAIRQNAARVRSDALKFAISTMRDQREKYRYLSDSLSVFENVLKGEIEESDLESIS